MLRPSALLVASLLLPACGAAVSAPARIPDLFELATPLEGAPLRSPLHLEGRARGSWYFEASFPVYLLDAAGDTIAAGPAHAIGEWMTADFVPFEVTLTFSAPASDSGTLVLAKDDPSGLRSLSAELRIPVRLR